MAANSALIFCKTENFIMVFLLNMDTIFIQLRDHRAFCFDKFKVCSTQLCFSLNLFNGDDHTFGRPSQIPVHLSLNDL